MCANKRSVAAKYCALLPVELMIKYLYQYLTRVPGHDLRRGRQAWSIHYVSSMTWTAVKKPEHLCLTLVRLIDRPASHGYFKVIDFIQDLTFAEHYKTTQTDGGHVVIPGIAVGMVVVQLPGLFCQHAGRSDAAATYRDGLLSDGVTLRPAG